MAALRWPGLFAASSPSNETSGVQFLSVVQGVGLAFVAALTLAVVLGLAAAWSAAWFPSDGLLRGVNLTVIAAGGFYCGRKTRRQGWLHGGLTGLVYVVLVSWMFIPAFGWGTLVSGPWLRETLLAFVAGAGGGMAGVVS